MKIEFVKFTELIVGAHSDSSRIAATYMNEFVMIDNLCCDIASVDEIENVISIKFRRRPPKYYLVKTPESNVITWCYEHEISEMLAKNPDARFIEAQ